VPCQVRENNAIRGALGKLIRLGETVNTSLVRECLELILMLADALEKKKAGPPITVSQNSLPATPQVAPVEPLASDRLEAALD
jgi:hypothetical protein